MGIEDVRLATAEEVREACPLFDTSDVLGALYAEREGYIDPSGVVHAYAKAAKMRGAEKPRSLSARAIAMNGVTLSARCAMAL